MDAVLMHKEIPVVDIIFDEESSVTSALAPFITANIFRLEYLNKMVLQTVLSSIPGGRNALYRQAGPGIKDALEELGIPNTKALLLRCYGLSLSDQYWVKPQNTNLSWRDINFFDNPFSDDVGDVLFGANKRKDVLDLSSPDNTSVGDLKKRWKIIDGKRCLVKGGQQPIPPAAIQ